MTFRIFAALTATGFLEQALHSIGQWLRVPCMVVLAALLVTAVWQAGSALAERFQRRRRVDCAALMQQLHRADRRQWEGMLAESGLLSWQKQALQALLAADLLPESRLALARRLLAQQEDLLGRVTNVTDLVARLGPVFGLLGTLIPLGPGIVALGQGDTAQLASSLAVAFDTTIAGLAAAAVASVISVWRKRWYEQDLGDLEALMECVLEEGNHAAGE